jgi:hypothetical protein
VAQQVGEAPPEELDWFALQLELPGLVGLEHWPRARPKGAVIEEDDVRPQQELRAQSQALRFQVVRCTMGGLHGGLLPAARPV